MNIFVFVSLVASLVCLALGGVVYSFNRKSIINKLFLLVSIVGFIYSLTTVLMWWASSPELAHIMNKAGTVWPLFVAVVLNFALVFTHSNWIKNRLNYIWLYVPALSFGFIDLTTDLINTPPVMKYWGFNDQPSGTWIYYVSTIWSASLALLAFYLCFRYYRQAKDPQHRAQRKFVAIGFFIPITMFIVTNMATRTANIEIPNTGIFGTLFFAIFVGYAITKYELFTIDPALASEQILSTMPDSLILTDINSRIIRVNERLENSFGTTEKELLGAPVSKLFVGSEDKCKAFLEELLVKINIRNFELTTLSDTGQKKYCLLSGAVVRNNVGKPIGLTLVIRDITERKNMEERLVKTERLASIGELAGQIGHDLRNPLAGMKNGVYLMKKKNIRLNEQESAKILDVIEVAIEDSNRIVTTLIDYSTELFLELERCTPKALVENALSRISVPKRITVINQATDESSLLLDKQKIEEAFVRILKNSIEAIPEEGAIEIRNFQDKDFVNVVFTDSGPGIQNAVLPKLFSPLVTTKAKGMGMGLAICKRIVNAHEGKISVENKQGKGAMFTVSLPTKLTVESIQQCNARPDFLR